MFSELLTWTWRWKNSLKNVLWCAFPNFFYNNFKFSVTCINTGSIHFYSQWRTYNGKKGSCECYRAIRFQWHIHCYQFLKSYMLYVSSEGYLCVISTFIYKQFQSFNNLRFVPENNHNCYCSCFHYISSIIMVIWYEKTNGVWLSVPDKKLHICYFILICFKTE